MQLKADLVNEVIFLLDADLNIRDGFHVVGPTLHETDEPVIWYIYRSAMIPPEHCILCMKPISAIEEACVSRHGMHAFTHVADRDDIAPHHKAEHWALNVVPVVFQDMAYVLDRENLMPINDIQQSLSV